MTQAKHLHIKISKWTFLNVGLTRYEGTIQIRHLSFNDEVGPIP